MGILISTMATLVRDSLEAFNKQSCLLSDVNMPLGKTSPSTTQRSPVASCLLLNVMGMLGKSEK